MASDARLIPWDIAVHKVIPLGMYWLGMVAWGGRKAVWGKAPKAGLRQIQGL